MEAGKKGLLCVARCVSMREGAARHSTPPASPAPAEEEDLIALGASGVSGFLSTQISPSPRPPGLAPPASLWQEVGWPWDFSQLPPSACYLSRQSRSLALGRWLWPQPPRAAERARRSPMSQPGEVPLCRGGPQVPVAPLGALPPTAGARSKGHGEGAHTSKAHPIESC